jgi:hypothetical protein
LREDAVARKSCSPNVINPVRRAGITLKEYNANPPNWLARMLPGA